MDSLRRSRFPLLFMFCFLSFRFPPFPLSSSDPIFFFFFETFTHRQYSSLFLPTFYFGKKILSHVKVDKKHIRLCIKLIYLIIVIFSLIINNIILSTWQIVCPSSVKVFRFRCKETLNNFKGFPINKLFSFSKILQLSETSKVRRVSYFPYAKRHFFP